MRAGLAALAWLACMGSACAAEVVAELRSEVLVGGAHITLADLAQLSASDPVLQQALGSIVLGSAPLAGHVDQRSQVELDLLWRSQPLSLQHTLVWRGAPRVRIYRRAQQLDSAQLLGLARQQLQVQFGADGGQIDANLAAPLPELQAPEGELQYHARIVDGSRLRARMAIWVDVLSQGAVYRSVLLPLTVTAQRRICVARHPLAAGSMAGADDFEQRTADVAGLDDVALAPDALSHGGRVRQAIAPGQIVTQHLMALGGMLLRGDHVQLRVNAAGISIETGATVLADAMPGQLVKVKPEHSEELMTARVMASGVVQLEER